MTDKAFANSTTNPVIEGGDTGKGRVEHRSSTVEFHSQLLGRIVDRWGAYLFTVGPQHRDHLYAFAEDKFN